MMTAIGPAPWQSFEESFTVAISVSAIGDNTVRAAVADRRWVVTKLVLIFGATGNTVTLKSGAGTNLSGAMPFPANSVLDTGDGDHIILRADNVNQAFVINLTANVLVTGWAQLKEIGQR